MPGNRHNSILSMPALTPASLGALIALYEHRTYISGRLWGLNSFDQWGVELGKEIGVAIHGAMTGEGSPDGLDPATLRHINAWRAARS
jgi:glucose-6-phosphate isomerase